MEYSAGNADRLGAFTPVVVRPFLLFSGEKPEKKWKNHSKRRGESWSFVNC
jgi:hypothetical protein